jgi:plastocyanin
MRRIFSLVLVACVATASPAAASNLSLRIVDAAGRPLPDAVVTAEVPGAAQKPVRFPWPYVMSQRNIMFDPHVLIVPVGATVRFPNEDRVRHHVYSFSKPAKFELKLYGKDQSRSYTFTSPGAVAVGCNIHDRMTGFIKVVSTPFADKTGADGRLTLSGLPAGAVKLTIWHPRIGNRVNEAYATVDLGTGTLTKDLRVQAK